MMMTYLSSWSSECMCGYGGQKGYSGGEQSLHSLSIYVTINILYSYSVMWLIIIQGPMSERSGDVDER